MWDMWSSPIWTLMCNQCFSVSDVVWKNVFRNTGIPQKSEAIFATKKWRVQRQPSLTAFQTWKNLPYKLDLKTTRPLRIGIHQMGILEEWAWQPRNRVLGFIDFRLENGPILPIASIGLCIYIYICLYLHDEHQHYVTYRYTYTSVMGRKGYISEPWVNPSQKDKLPRINKPHDSITSAWEYTMGLYTRMKKSA